jgi:hypothetical protein
MGCGTCQTCEQGTCAPVSNTCPFAFYGVACGSGDCRCTLSTEGTQVCVDSTRVCLDILACTHSSECPSNYACVDFHNQCPGDISCSGGITVACMPICA